MADYNAERVIRGVAALRAQVHISRQDLDRTLPHELKSFRRWRWAQMPSDTAFDR